MTQSIVARAGSSLEFACAQEKPGGFMANIRVLATDLEFPEGPVVMPDGSVVLVEIRGKRLTRVYPDGRKEVVAQIPGGSAPTARCTSATMAASAGSPPAR
jgi:sugar lactone lactonase YvrE